MLECGDTDEVGELGDDDIDDDAEDDDDVEDDSLHLLLGESLVESAIPLVEELEEPVE